LKPNSKEWWNDTFKNDWDRKIGLNGPSQTRYFMELIVKHCGLNIQGDILDYGCAMGQGVDVLAKYGHAEGYDFSDVACDKASQLYPYTFYNSIPQKQYDVVVCSNVLEHFENPIDKFMELIGLSRKYVIAMVPYNQTPACEIHPVTITENTFPEVDGFKKTYKHIPNEKPEMGGSNQIMFIYERYI
jgi:2-polyprenyl-3-methyl-5-hydroxy-6-metoxy-1,4-benzoquinol methylase